MSPNVVNFLHKVAFLFGSVGAVSTTIPAFQPYAVLLVGLASVLNGVGGASTANTIAQAPVL